MTVPELLVVVPCGQGKIWDRHPDAGPTLARDAYTGAPFRVNRAYAERFATRWVILSAKYGFIGPDFVIPGPYNLTFKRRDPELVDSATLRAQVAALDLTSYSQVVVLGGQEYQKAARDAFVETDATLHFPFAGLRMGQAMAAIKEAMAKGDPLPLGG
jgi:hypothetical protein